MPSPGSPPIRILELLWWSFMACAIVVPVLVALTIHPNPAAAPTWAEAAFTGGLLASLPVWLVKRHFDQRLRTPAFTALPEQERLRRFQVAMFVGLAVAELPLYAGLAHYILTGQAIGMTILTLISLSLMLLFHPSRLARAG
jgi:hypothetical protein